MDAERSFGGWLRQRRRALDLTQEELAQQVGCSAITLRKLEAESRRPSKQVAERLADVLKVPAKDRPAFLRFARGDPFAGGSSTAGGASSALGHPNIPGSPTAAAPDSPVPPAESTATPAWPPEPAMAEARAAEAGEAPAPGESPYQGLRYFDEADAELFFGREALVARLVGRLAALGDADRQFLAVVGASGSGKSSIVRAGLVPALRHSAGEAAGGPAPLLFQQIHVITPTAHPLETLAVSLTGTAESVTATATLMDDLARDARSLHLYAVRLVGRPSQPAALPLLGARPRLLLVVDQFEEVFTLCRGEAEQQAFVDNLMTAAEPAIGGPVTVVITLRADFYSHCAPYPGLRDALAEQQEYIGPMTAAELRQAIEQPARLGGWALEPGLVDQVLRDVGAGDGREPEPGALPLLSHALLETWRHRRGRTLLLRSYAEAGRVQGAIASSAEAVLQSLSPEEQASARNIFLRLTELGEGTQDTRRRVALAELLPAGDAAGAIRPVAQVLKTLSDARLITQDQDSVEVAHEALIREWPTLRQWLSENREGLRLHRRLTEAAQEWDALNREPSELYRGPRLAQALEWAEWAPHQLELNALEREFLQASQALAEREAVEREAQRQRELVAAQQLAQTAQKLAATEKAQAEAERQATLRLRLRNRIITGVGALAIIIALWAALLASRNGSLAATSAASASAAQAAARLSNARELALSASNNLDVDPQLGLLLALQAVNLTYAVDHTVLPEAAGALHSAVMAAHLQLSLPVLSGGEVVGVAFSADGTRLATLDGAGTVKLWDTSPALPAGQNRLLFSLPTRVLIVSDLGWQDLAFSPDGTLVAAGGEDNVTIWNTKTGGVVSAFTVSTVTRAIGFSPDGQRLAISGYNTPVLLYEVATGRLLGTVGKVSSTQSLAFSPDGQRLAVGARDQTQVWDVSSNQPLLTLPAEAGAVNAVLFSPDGSRLATAGADGTARLWDAATGQGQLVIHAHVNVGLAFSPDGSQLATGGADGVARVWDAHTGLPLYARTSPTQLVFGVAFSPDGSRLATANSDGTARVWDTKLDQELTTLAAAPSAVFSVAFSPDGSRLITGGADRRTRLWDAATGQELAGPSGRLDAIRSAVYSHDGRRIATASDFGQPKVYDAATGQLLLTLYGHLLTGWSVAYSPDDTRLATGSQEGPTTVWDAGTGQELLTLPGTYRTDFEIFVLSSSGLGAPSNEKVAGVAFSPDGTRLVTNNYNPVVTVWSLPHTLSSSGAPAAGKALLTLSGHTDVVEAVAYSPDGRWIATGSRDGTARVWDAATGAGLLTLAGHTTSVVSVAFSPDGTHLATGSLDGTAKLWDVASGQLLQNLPGHTAGVTSVAFSPDGTRLAVASLDGTTRLYELQLDKLIALAQARIIRRLTSQECQQYLHGPCPVN
jgi:WD40 repeat protein/transcriptional regulator with XRE-family HTH domain